ncbi:Kazal-like serine protease inhibitor domain containing hypothetical protein [Phytophthora palmivora]|uniref:Kazal-like domain-containing protein n=1 Tax=Phytophthora palmivora TaxID=4796 RepID=A0A2P4XRW7_9STRA|nr:Kazal-like serine protease inhibitor domain containing hypothetical protein [Phytophthora palmivora]
MKPSIGIMPLIVVMTNLHDVNSLNILPVTEFGSPSVFESFCPRICHTVMNPVFDDKGIMYSNECKMQAAKCKQKKNNGNTLPTTTEKPSILESFCPDACLAVMKPVYDENGVMYTNECKMRAAKCKKKKFANMEETSRDHTDESESNTNDSSDGQSDSDEDSTYRKKVKKRKCTGICPDIIMPVCGSDGVKYSNPCQLKLASCKKPELNIVLDDNACTSSTKSIYYK